MYCSFNIQSVVSQPQLPQQRAQQQQQRGWSNRAGVRRGRGRSSGNAGFGRQGQQQTVTQSAKSKTLKFDNDYDFEQANTEFEELRIQLAKTKIGKFCVWRLCDKCYLNGYLCIIEIFP